MKCVHVPKRISNVANSSATLAIQIFIYIGNRVAESVQKSLRLESKSIFDFRNYIFLKHVNLIIKLIYQLLIC